MSLLAWVRFRIPPEEPDEVAREREVWASLLRLLLPRPHPGQAVEDGRTDGWCLIAGEPRGMS